MRFLIKVRAGKSKICLDDFAILNMGNATMYNRHEFD